MNKPAPMTPAQRQAKRRQKLITAARELEALNILRSCHATTSRKRTSIEF